MQYKVDDDMEEGNEGRELLVLTEAWTGVLNRSIGFCAHTQTEGKRALLSRSPRCRRLDMYLTMISYYTMREVAGPKEGLRKAVTILGSALYVY